VRAEPSFSLGSGAVREPRDEPSGALDGEARGSDALANLVMPRRGPHEEPRAGWPQPIFSQIKVHHFQFNSSLTRIRPNAKSNSKRLAILA
jgi:hypothetical protein